MKTKAVFIDRYGIINEDYGYIYKWNNFRFLQKMNMKN